MESKRRYFYILIILVMCVFFSKTPTYRDDFETKPVYDLLKTSDAIIGHYDTDGDSQNVFISGDVAYIADASNGLVCVNVTDPNNLDEIGHYDSSGSAMGVYVSGDVAYIADEVGGLLCINITDPTNP